MPELHPPYFLHKSRGASSKSTSVISLHALDYYYHVGPVTALLSSDPIRTPEKLLPCLHNWNWSKDISKALL